MRKIFDHERITTRMSAMRFRCVCHWSNNMHVLTPRAELLKIFDIVRPGLSDSYVCLVVSDNRTKVYVFQDL